MEILNRFFAPTSSNRALKPSRVVAGLGVMLFAGTCLAGPQPGPFQTIAPPERIPYSEDVVGDCNEVNCFYDFSEVPEGFMLVIEHASGIIRPDDQATVVDFAELITSQTLNEFGARHYFNVQLIGMAGASVVANTWGFNAPVLAHVEPGQSARVTTSQSVAGSVLFSQATLTGYLVELPGDGED